MVSQNVLFALACLSAPESQNNNAMTPFKNLSSKRLRLFFLPDSNFRLADGKRHIDKSDPLLTGMPGNERTTTPFAAMTYTLLAQALPAFMLLSFVFLVSPAPAAAHTPDLDREQPDDDYWTPADIVRQESASQLTFSPDGTMVAWVKSRNSTEKDRNVTDLYLTRLDQKNEDDTGTSSDDNNSSPYLTIQLTRSEESDRNPVFSRDGRLLYFLSSREDGKTLWAMNLYGGEPYEVHAFDEGLRSIQILDDGTLLFVSAEGDLLIEAERKERKDNTRVIEDTVTFKPSRLFSFDPDSKRIRRLTDNQHPISTYAASDDGRWAVTGHTRSPHYGADAQPPPSYYFWDLESGRRIRILQGLQTPGSFAFTEDHKGFYFTAVSSSDPEWSGAGISELYYVTIPDDLDLVDHQDREYARDHENTRNDENTRDDENTVMLEPVKVHLDWEWALSSGFNVVGNDVLASLANGPTRILAHYERRGNGEWRKRLVDTGKYDERVSVAALAEDHKQVVYVHATASTLPQYRIGELDVRRRSARISEGEHLVRLNTALSKKHIADSEIFRWTGAEDNEVNGILYYPENYEPGRRYPLVVAIRGGPAAVTLDWWNMNWAYFPHILSQKESFVLMPNYHGSSNHGLEFVESIKGRYYELELVDIVNGIETLHEAGKVDKDSLGVMGWSNGSILSIALSIEHPDMFKVIGAGAGNVNWVSDYGTCQFGVRFDQSYFGGAPWDSADGTFYNRTYIEKSPIFRMERVKAPTIIFFGSEDRAVPRDQGWEHYRALQQLGNAPVRFLWFPDQPHGLQKLTHQRRKLEEEIAWFDRWLFETYDEPNRAFKDDSPLAGLFKRDSLAIDDGYFGLRNSDRLIPEVVPVGEDTIAIGRFAVTNIQYQEFDSTHTFHPLQANYPVRNIRVDKARAYARWLGEYTGNTYRLPNAEETQALHRIAHRAGPRQNTLNRLAGFDITIDEVGLLRQKMDLLAAEQLIREVGSFPPVKVGEAEIYDLGGNVAEWSDAGSDNGRSVYGYSARDFVDTADPGSRELDPEFTGFRVIREAN